MTYLWVQFLLLRVPKVFSKHKTSLPHTIIVGLGRQQSCFVQAYLQGTGPDGGSFRVPVPVAIGCNHTQNYKHALGFRYSVIGTNLLVFVSATLPCPLRQAGARPHHAVETFYDAPLCSPRRTSVPPCMSYWVRVFSQVGRVARERHFLEPPLFQPRQMGVYSVLVFE